ncbi:Putative peptidase [Candidatus Phytoplasma australiense]|uniref:Putative peptidase n=1 Tax=Phytoplasma australiense TaxID=59748 RepID=B1V939_PHYAS|nr:Putative peptidase [Candidatus Phytoplasma australiense]
MLKYKMLDVYKKYFFYLFNCIYKLKIKALIIFTFVLLNYKKKDVNFMKWEPERFEDEMQPPKQPIPVFPLFPKKRPDYLLITTRVLSIIVNLLLISFIAMLIDIVQDYKKASEKKDNKWAAEKQYKPIGKKQTIDDFIGYEEVKDELQKYIEEVKTPPNKSQNLSRGILLYGPPGTGKTFLAKCLAGSVKDYAPFFITTGSDFVEKYVGVGAFRVRSLFEAAKNTAIVENKNYFFVFIDEIDAIGGKRSDDNRNIEHHSTLNALLAEIDGFSSSDKESQPIIIAATNRKDALDEALIRDGRLGKHIYLGLPDLKTTKEFMQKAFSSFITSPGDLEALSKVIHGSHFSPAQIMALTKEAKKRLSLQQSDGEKINIIYEAMDSILMGPENKSERSEQDSQRVIDHELGHALVATALGFQVHHLSIKSRGQAGGYTISFPEKDTKLPTKLDLIKHIIVALGGRAAESISFQEDISVGCGSDLQKASNVAKNMVIQWGMKLQDDRFSSLNENEHQNEEIQKIIEESYKIAKEILRYFSEPNQAQKKADLINKLRNQKTLNKTDFESIQYPKTLKIDKNQGTLQLEQS